MLYTVIGVFADRNLAEDAISALQYKGFEVKNISILMKDKSEGQKIATNTGASVVGGASTGAATGAVVGGLTGLLVGVGAIAIPGIGAFLIGGPLATALGLSGAAATAMTGVATGALAGGLIGALMGLGLPEQEARVYETKIKEGGILIAVPARGEHIDIARDILEEYNATQIRTITMPTRYVDEIDKEKERTIDREHPLSQTPGNM